MAVAADGSLYIADSGNHRIRRIGLDGIITTVAGGGDGGDGSLATAAQLDHPVSVAIGTDGSLYIADNYNHNVRRVRPDGIITTVAGDGLEGYGGDGDLATAAHLYYPGDVTVGADGSLYIADCYNHRVRRVGLDGIITTVAGNGKVSYSGDGGPAAAAQLDLPMDVTLVADGSIYIADGRNYRIRRVGPDGIITTVAGDGTRSYSGDGGPAAAAQLYGSTSVAAGPDGSLYITDNQRIRRVGPDGIINTVAGNGTAGYSGDGGLATLAQLGNPSGVAVGTDGTLFITEANGRIRRVGTDGIITTVAGNGTAGYSGDGGPATTAQLHNPSGVAVGADGNLYIADGGNNRIRRIALTLPGIKSGETTIPAEDGSEVYVFDVQGRHLRTVNALNGAIIYLFNYNDTGLLISVQDGDGNITVIERDASGIAAAIVAPGGQRTALTVNADGYLDGIACPLGEVTRLAYDSNGMLTSLTDHKGNIHQYTYDTMGRLIKDADPAGGYTALTRTEQDNGYAVTATTALGRASTYSVEQLSAGGMRHVNTSPNGAQIIAEKGTDGITTVTNPNGTVAKTVKGPDPRWGMQAPLVSSTVTTPGGLQRTRVQTGFVMYDPADASRMKTLSYTTSVNGRKYIGTYDAELNQKTNNTPLGIKSVTKLDVQGRAVQRQLDSLDPLNYTYDSRGNLTNVNHSDQTLTYVYDSKNRVVSATDTVGNQAQYVYDDANRVTSVTVANGSSYQYDYDANGNCIQITMPSGAVHNLDYTVLNQASGYTPPENGTYAASYDLDKAPIRRMLPGGRTVDASYDTGGRLTGVSYDAASVSVSYADATSRVSSITRTPTDNSIAQTMSFNYDGSLVTKMTNSGIVNGQYSYRYNNDFALVGMTLDNGSETVFTRNEDGMLTGYGPFTITRNGPAGAPDSLSDGVLNTTLGYDSKGRLIDRSHTVNGQQEYRLQLAYNNISKIIQKMENIGGVVNTYDYTYDVIGQLTEVKRNGVVVETYTYDVNGNRTSRRLGVDPVETATYDAQDRLITLGNVSYSFNADGFLTQRGSDTFVYSATGELLKATLANGTEVSYAYDGMNRRIGRTVNGQTYKYLYGSLGNPYQVTATIEPDGTLSSYYYDTAGVLFAIQRAGNRYYVSADHVGSPKVIVDSTGAVLKALEYDSFGNMVSDSNTAFYLPMGFAGGIADADTGLIRFGMRDYDPVAGRWTAKDPIFFKGGQANLYAYCYSNPVNYVDTDGLFAFVPIIIGGEALKDLGLGLAALIVAAMILNAKDKGDCESGSYTNEHQSGKKYHGKGDEQRAADSGKRIAGENKDPLVSTDHTKAPNDREGFKDEARRLEKDGGHKSPTNYNRRASPGKKYLEQDGD